MDNRTNIHFRGLENRPNLGLLKLAIPLVVAFSIQTGFNVVDTIFVGRLGPDAIAGLSIAYPFQMMMYAIGGGLGIGAQSLISRFIGANDPESARYAVYNSVILAAICTFFTVTIGLFGVGYIVSLFGAPNEVNSFSLEYLYVVISGSVFLYLMLSMDAMLRGEGNTRLSMYFMGFSAILNLVMDPFFIFTLDMGVRGAAIATVLARAIVSSYMCYYIFVKKRYFIEVSLGKIKYSFETIRHIVGIGIPASMTQLSYSLSLFAMNTILATYGGVAIAAFGIGFRIESMAFLPMFGMAGAFVSAVGYFRGSGQYHKMLGLKNFAYGSTIVFMSLCALVFFLFPETIYGIFTSSPEVISLGRDYLLINVLVYPLVPFTSISAAGFQGLGRGHPPFLIALLRSWLIVIPLSWFFAFHTGQGITFIWWSMVIGNTVSALIGGIWFFVGTKRFKAGIGTDNFYKKDFI